MRVTAEDIGFVTRLVDELCGVVLDDTKAYLIESRLSELAGSAGCASYRELCERARISKDRDLQNRIIDAITTQETLFFRDSNPFEALQHRILPDLIDARAATAFPRRLRFWSAACSTGQEPYSIAMALTETIPDVASWDIQIHATDISDAAIKQASMGRYGRHEIQRGMQPRMLAKYFTEEANGWRVRDSLRAMISFTKRNLLETFSTLGTFDVIFCRNVAIYFDPPRRRDLFLRLGDRLARDGCLFVGASESLLDLGTRFAPQNHCRATFYRQNPAGGVVKAT
jgi:chemotaxis protein methyltransferase CheR